MLGLAIIAAGGQLGVGVVRRLGWEITRLEAIALAAAFALATMPWVLFLAAWSLGFASGMPVACVILGASGLLLGRRRPLRILPSRETSWLSWAALAVLFALLFHGHMFHAQPDGLYTGGSSYGDLGLHGTLASRFATAEVDFTSPIVAGEPLTYPFLGDFLVACLVRGGWSMSNAFAFTGWVSAMTALALLHALALRLFRRRAAAVVAVWLVVLSGALVGLWYAAQDLATRGVPGSPGELPSYANMWTRGVTWSNLVCDFLLPQRAFLAGFPLMWAVLWLVRAVVDDEGPRPLAAVAAGILVGALPFLHVHSFLLGAGYLLAFAIWRAARRRGDAALFAIALVIAIALAAPQLAWQLGQSWGTSFGRWNLGWRAPHGEFWWYWLRNWGVPLVLVPAAVWSAWRLAHGSFALPYLLASLAVFALANVYQFQPHDWDNMKLLVYAHMGVAVMLGGWLSALLDRGALRRLLAAVAIVAMTGTGALSLVRELDHRARIASAADVRIAAEVRRRVPTDARVLTADRHNHAVAMLAGRRIVMGYRGWLWTHGYDARPLAHDVAQMFRGDARAVLLFARHGVTHVYIGPAERQMYHPDVERFRARYETVVERDGVVVFDVRGRPPRLAQGPRR